MAVAAAAGDVVVVVVVVVDVAVGAAAAIAAAVAVVIGAAAAALALLLLLLLLVPLVLLLLFLLLLLLLGDNLRRGQTKARSNEGSAGRSFKRNCKLAFHKEVANKSCKSDFGHRTLFAVYSRSAPWKASTITEDSGTNTQQSRGLS